MLSLCFMLSCNESKAQIAGYSNTDSTSAGTYTTITSTTSDTLYDATTIYTMYTRTGSFKNVLSPNMYVTFDVTKITGTGTATVFLQVSRDGITWRNANLASVSGAWTRVTYPGKDGLCTDSLAIAAASTTALKYEYLYVPNKPIAVAGTVYYVAGGVVNYARLKIVGAGTQVTKYSNFNIRTFNN